MHVPGIYNPNGTEAMVRALRGAQGTQYAGDVVNAPFPTQNYQTNGPAADSVMEMAQKLKGADRSNVSSVPFQVYEKYLTRQPQMAYPSRPPPVVLPPIPLTPTDPHGQGGNLPPKM